MNYSLLRSKTFWTIVAMFFVGGINAITQVIPADLQAPIMAILAILASVFHLQTGKSIAGSN